MRVAIVHPTSLLARELRERLEERTDLWSELRLMSTREEEIGTVTEVAGHAALVERLQSDSMAGIDLLLVCDDSAHTAPLLLDLPPTVTVVVLSRDATSAVGQVLVDGINLDGADLGQVLVSPHPAVLALSRLLMPMRALGLNTVNATVLQPVSFHGEEALDEVFAQTRNLLAFRPVDGGGTFAAQMAFNLLPTDDAVVPQLCRDLLEVLEMPLALSLQIIQAGVFHGLSISACCRFDTDPGDAALREALARAPGIELAESPQSLGPVHAASSSDVLVGHVRAAEEWPGAYWLWLVADHLVLETANVVAISTARSAGR